MGKWLRRIFILLLLLVLVGVGGFYFLVHQSDSTIDGTVLVEGVSQPIRIIRDIYGIPHIFAQNDRDVTFALGYVEAQDRLWQLDMNRHLGAGTLSALFGSLTLDLDLLFRTIFPQREVERAWQALLPPSIRDECDAFAQGVNAFLSQHSRKLPMEFWLIGHQVEPFTASDCVWTNAALFWFLGMNVYDEVLAAKLAGKIDPVLLPELFPEAPDTILPGEVGIHVPHAASHQSGNASLPSTLPFAGIAHDVLPSPPHNLAAFPFAFPGAGLALGSNSWVIGGERTTTGKPILASDPHVFIGMPSVWYEVHLVAPGVDVVGVVTPGAPVIQIGHNRRIAWGATNLTADMQDLFIEKVNPDNPRQVWFVDHWEDMRIEKLSIPVKGQAPVEKEALYTRHGPVVTPLFPGLKDTLAVQWLWPLSAGATHQDFEGFRLLHQAANWEEFRAALRNFTIGTNMMYADVEGNIGWQVTGRIPIRAKGDDRFPVPGWTGEYEWTGFIPFEELPSYYLPADGTAPRVIGSPISSAPTYAIATANQRIVRSDYKYPISNSWVPPYRFLRIGQLLGQKEKMSVQDIQHYQADRHPLLADMLLPILTEISAETEDLRLAVKILCEWDGQMTRDSSAATLYELTLFHLIKNTFSDELGDLYNDYALRSGGLYSGLDAIISQPQAKWWDDVRTPEVETRVDIVRRSLQDAIEDARKRLGTNPAQWRWGDLHPAVFAHGLGRQWPLNWLLNRVVPYGGDSHTVNVGYYRLDQPFNAWITASFRMVVDMSDITHAYAMNTTGQSGRPFTPHYSDMIQSWADVQYHPMWMDEADITAHAEGTLLLIPSSAPK